MRVFRTYNKACEKSYGTLLMIKRITFLQDVVYNLYNNLNLRKEAKTWLNDKYPKNLGAKFTKIWKEDETTWSITGTVLIKIGMMKKARKTFKLQLGSESGEIIGYSDY